MTSMRYFFSRALPIALAALAVSGCSVFGGSEDPFPPAELERFDSAFKLKKVWSKGIGRNSSLLRLALGPASNGDVIVTTGPKGRVSAFDAKKGRKLWSKKTRMKLAGGAGVDGSYVAIGSTDSVEIPDGARIVDVSGKTITPGFIDAHAHGPQGTDDIIPQQNWSTIAHLALGVTTIHDPSSRASHIFTSSEYQRAGMQLAPRTYSTGEVVYGARAPGFYASIEDYTDAEEHVFRLAEQGAHSIKNYNQPRREQRQQVVAASIAANVAVVAEGGSNYHMDMAMVADGNTSIEHNLPPAMLYEDVLSMYSQTEVAYTPTLTVTYGGLAGDPYWRQATDVWLHPILSQHVPPTILQSGSVRRTTAPESDFVDGVNANTARLLMDRGVLVSIGAHGQQEGLASHWEMWSFVRGGFTPWQALRAATLAPAQHLGFDNDLGSLEVGKLADLVIMDANPLEDIGNTDEIDMVMLNGRLYDADTMNEVVTGDAEREAYYWE